MPDRETIPRNWLTDQWGKHALPLQHLELFRWQSMEIQKIYFSFADEIAFSQQYSLSWLFPSSESSVSFSILPNEKEDSQDDYCKRISIFPWLPHFGCHGSAQAPKGTV